MNVHSEVILFFFVVFLVIHLLFISVYLMLFFKKYLFIYLFVLFIYLFIFIFISWMVPQHVVVRAAQSMAGHQWPAPSGPAFFFIEWDARGFLLSWPVLNR